MINRIMRLLKCLIVVNNAREMWKYLIVINCLVGFVGS